MAGTLSAPSYHPCRQVDWGECLEWAMGHLSLEKVGLCRKKKVLHRVKYFY